MMENELEFETPYESFVYAIRSPVTREKYLGRISNFISFVGITEGNIEQRCNIFGEKSKADSKWLANNVIRYLRVHREREERREISASTISGYIKPIKLFCEQLEVSLPWKRITRGLPKGRRYANDRIPSIDEIKRIIEYPDRRIKPIVFTMASSGIRLGAWSYLKWGHISPIEKVNKEVVVNTEEMHLQNKPSAIQGLYNELKENIYSIGQDITLKPKRVYVAFIRKTNFVDVVPRKSDIQLFLNLQKGMLSDPKNMARDISNLGHHGNGDYEIKLSNSNEMGYVTSLIRQSYDKN
jgi:predicted transport protein